MISSNINKAYHIHIYYDITQKEIATSLRNDFINFINKYGIHKDFVDVGAMHDRPVGPHPKPMFRIATNNHTTSAMFHTIFNHLQFHRNGLSVLIHPETNESILDHTDRAVWIGSKLDLLISNL